MHGFHPIRPDLAGQNGFACVKAHKRLYIQDLASGALLYTHPDFIVLQSRTPMQALAAAACARGALDIRDIVAFEIAAPRRPGNRRDAYKNGAHSGSEPDVHAATALCDSFYDAITRQFFPTLFQDAA